jgi:hypothetical protein
MALKRRSILGNRVFSLAMPFLLAALAGCAEVQVRTLAPPPPTAKLRVFAQAVSDQGNWKMSNGEFAQRVPNFAERVLHETGIYEVTPRGDSKSIFTGPPPSSRGEWAKKDWDLARRVGRAVHADYVIIVGRSMHKGNVLWEMMFLNMATGKKYRSVSRISIRPDWNVEDYAKIFRITYREIFREAKGDILAAAIGKSHGAPPVEEVKSQAPRRTPSRGEAPAPATSPAVLAKTSPPERPFPAKAIPIDVAPEDLAGTEVLDLGKILADETSPDSRKRLAVYDLDTTEPLKVIGLILSEALRQELTRLGHFALVNRENLIQVLKETELQMTGLVDEKQAVQMGKGLAASQIVMGRYGALGKTSVLQAKRVDVETQRTLSVGSLKCPQGQEDELLGQMGELARKLTGDH